MLFSKIRAIFVPQVDLKTSRYVKKSSIMNQREQLYFKQLLDTYSDFYYVFPQISMSNLVEVESNGIPDPRLNVVFRCRVDFVLVDKNTFETVSVIELDGASHQNIDTIIRDIRVEKALKACQINLTRIPNYK